MIDARKTYAHGLSDVRDIAANAALFSAGPELDPADPEGITLGIGLARILDIRMPPPGTSESRPFCFPANNPV